METAKLKETLYAAVCGVSIAFTAGSSFLGTADYIRQYDIVIQKVDQTEQDDNVIDVIKKFLLDP